MTENKKPLWKKLLQPEHLILAGIILLGLFLRIYKLDSIPAGFFCDEASIGYNAYTILTTGKDEYRESFPLFFRSFNDYKGGVAIYSTVPFVAVLGLTERATRLPSVMYGILTILFLFALGKETVSKQFGLITAFFAATMPWLLHYDRVAFLMNVYVTFFVATTYLFLKARRLPHYLPLAFLTAGVTIYTYQPPKLIIPLLILGCLSIFYKDYKKHMRFVFLGFSLFLIMCIPLILSFLAGEALSRFNMVSVFSSNKSFTELLTLLLSHYFFQFTPEYLFFKGEPTFITRHFTNGFTPLLAITAPFLILGFLTILKNRKQKFYQFLLFWMILYPIGGTLVLDPPFSSRSIIGAPLAAIVVACGMVTFLNLVKRFQKSWLSLIAPALIICSISLNILAFFYFYFFKYPLYSADFWGWQYGPREIITYFKTEKDNYDDLVMIPEFNAPHIFFKFYAPDDCQKCLLGTPTEVYNPTRKQLFALSPQYLAKNPSLKFKTKKTIYYPNTKVAFQIGEVVQ